MRNPKIIETHNALNIFSLKHLSLQLGIPGIELIDVSDNIKRHYTIQEKVFFNPDGSQKKTRLIYHPSLRLEKILTSINKYLLNRIELPSIMHGARKKHNIITNAQEHTGKKYVKSLDIANFFPSIRPNHVFNTFKRLKCSSAIATLLKKLCTADNHVPQGYNTSPNIANLVLVTVANRISHLCKKQGLSVTIFVDDITISSNKDPEKYIKTVEKIINECGFNLKPEKSICMKSHEKQKVTGIVVNKKINFDKLEYRDLSAKIHICTTCGLSPLVGHLRNKKGEILDTSDKVKNHLAGRLSHLNRINPLRIAKLKNKFTSINWTVI